MTKAAPPTQVILINFYLQMLIPPHTIQLKANNTIFLDDTNINNDSGPIISGDQQLLTDPKEHKRKRERDRYAQLSDQQKDESAKESFARRTTMHIQAN